SSFIDPVAPFNLPNVPVTASIEVWGPATADSSINMVVSGVFKEPVVITETGTLWLGYTQSVEPINGHSACQTSVPVTMAELADPSNGGTYWYRQTDEPGWMVSDPFTNRDSPPLIEVVLAD
ncbi:MAG: hypothetical protein VX127_15975, partial [Myxococcota bacterium]|nr:hypothetical protein [Myxococcota bacterium]